MSKLSLIYIYFKPKIGLSQNPKTFEEMWSTGVIVAEIEGNRNAPMHLDFAQEYFHDFALTENFVILGLSR